MKEKTIWIAIAGKNYIFATWYEECEQSYKSWRHAVLCINPNAKIIYRKIKI